MKSDAFKAHIEEKLEREYSLTCRDEVVELIADDSERFEALWELVCCEKPPIPQRAAWVLEALNSQYPFHAERYAPRLLAQIPKMIHQMELRAATRILAETPIQAPMIPEMWGLMLEFFLDPKTPPALRVNAMELLYQISHVEPGFKYELRLVINEHLHEAGPYLLSRGKKNLKQLEKEIRKLEMNA